jgi:hypothetical protein
VVAVEAAVVVAAEDVVAVEGKVSDRKISATTRAVAVVEEEIVMVAAVAMAGEVSHCFC